MGRDCNRYLRYIKTFVNRFNVIRASADKFHFIESKVIQIFLIKIWWRNFCFETSNFKWSCWTPNPSGPVSPLSLSRVDLYHVVCIQPQPICPSVIPPVILFFLLPQLNAHKVLRSSYQFPLSPVPQIIFTGFQYFSS